VAEEMTNKLRRLFSSISIGLLGVALAAVGQEPSSRFLEQATVTVIEVPVVVLKDGSPVRDLAVDDFVLLQDGIEQSITGFERVELSRLETGAAVAEQSPISLGGRRYFFLAFDLSHTQPVNALRAVAAARDLMQNGLHPTDLVGVSLYSATAGARLLHPFTADHLKLESALLAVEAVTSRDPAVLDRARATLEADDSEAADSLRRFLVEIKRFISQQGVGLESTVGPAGEWLMELGPDGGGGRRGELLAEILTEMEAEYQEAIVNVVRDRSLDLLETLADLATALKDVRGQKYFVLFSEGVDEAVLENPFDSVGKKQLSQVVQSFRRSGWVVQSVDVGRPDINTRGMFFLANETGGDQFQNYNDLSQAMGRMLEQTSVSYMLSFQPPELAFDGRYHEIEVRLKKPAGVKVRHRDGYYAPQPSEEEIDLVAVGDRIASYGDGGAFEVSGMAAPFKLDGATALVPVVLEIHGPSLVEVGHEREIVDLQVDAYLVDAHLGAIPLLGKRIAVDLAQHGELVATGGLKLFADIRLAPGEHRLRFVINDAALSRRAVATMAVSVPDYQNNNPHILEPFFPETSIRWLLVNLTEPDADRGASFPFQFGDRKFVPQVQVTLGQDEVVPICLVAFNLPPSDPSLKLDLSAADGNPLEGDFVQIASAPEKTADGAIRLMARLDTTGLAAGEYSIRVSHRDDQGDGVTESSRSFRVR